MRRLGLWLRPRSVDGFWLAEVAVCALLLLREGGVSAETGAQSPVFGFLFRGEALKLRVDVYLRVTLYLTTWKEGVIGLVSFVDIGLLHQLSPIFCIRERFLKKVNSLLQEKGNISTVVWIKVLWIG